MKKRVLAVLLTGLLTGSLLAGCGGAEGGEIVTCGTPGELCACERSKTGFYLKKYLSSGR